MPSTAQRSTIVFIAVICKTCNFFLIFLQNIFDFSVKMSYFELEINFAMFFCILIHEIILIRSALLFLNADSPSAQRGVVMQPPGWSLSPSRGAGGYSRCPIKQETAIYLSSCPLTPPYMPFGVRRFNSK